MPAMLNPAATQTDRQTYIGTHTDIYITTQRQTYTQTCIQLHSQTDTLRDMTC